MLCWQTDEFGARSHGIEGCFIRTAGEYKPMPELRPLSAESSPGLLGLVSSLAHFCSERAKVLGCIPVVGGFGGRALAHGSPPPLGRERGLRRVLEAATKISLTPARRPPCARQNRLRVERRERRLLLTLPQAGTRAANGFSSANTTTSGTIYASSGPREMQTPPPKPNGHVVFN